MSEKRYKPDAFNLKTLILFTLITFIIAWGILGFYIFLNDQATQWLGQISGTHPLFFISVWAPAIAAIAIITPLRGVKGLKQFALRLSFWRLSSGWVVFIVAGIPAVFFIGALIKGQPLIAPILSEGLFTVLAAMGLMLFLGPLEELGWRGLALPVLQRYMAPAWAAIVIGAIWGIWHLPAFYLAGTLQSEWSFAPFFIGNICLSLIVTPVFNRSQGSLLWPMLFHYQLINPVWPDAQPYDTYLLAGISLLILIFFRDEMFSSKRACTRVFPTTSVAVTL